LQTSALPLGYAAGPISDLGFQISECKFEKNPAFKLLKRRFGLTACVASLKTVGAGNEIRTRDFDLGKVALYH
jgi:hypothetical protein